MKFIDKLIDRIAEAAAEKAYTKMKQEKASQIGFRTVEPENLYEAQWHNVPLEK